LQDIYKIANVWEKGYTSESASAPVDDEFEGWFTPPKGDKMDGV